MSDSQNKTEKATPKHKSDARKKGRVPRSRESVSFVILLASALIFFITGSKMYDHFKKVLILSFSLKRKEAFNFNLLLYKAKILVFKGFLILLPFFAVIIFSAYFGTIALGGRVFSLEKIQPKLSNISPKNAFSRIFSSESLYVLLQSLLKTIITGIILYTIIKSMYPSLLNINLYNLNGSMKSGFHYLLVTFLILAFSTFIYALIDYPYQIYKDSKSLKMSKQQVRDEYKNTEGNPEIKGKLRAMQRKTARRQKAMRDLPKADLLITNPTHFAVALHYDDKVMDAPVIVALGADMMAFHIRRLCTEYNTPILEIPILARALYYYGEVGKAIPEELFYAVARVVAYIFGLDDPLAFYLEQDWIEQLPIPEEFMEEPNYLKEQESGNKI